MGAASSTGRKIRPGPARGVIVSKDRARKLSKKKGGGTLRNAWQVEFSVTRELAYDLDVRKIVDHIRVALMEHYRKSLLAGRTAGGRTLPKTRPKTREKFGGGSIFGVRTGWMANNWWSGKIRGGPFRAFVLVKPNGSAGGPTPKDALPRFPRGFMINAALRRRPSVDFQSVRGPARKVIGKAFNEAISDGFGVVSNKPTPRTNEGVLPILRGT